MRTTITIQGTTDELINDYKKGYLEAFGRTLTTSAVIESALVATLPVLINELPQENEPLVSTLLRRAAMITSRISKSVSSVEILGHMKHAMLLQADCQALLLSKNRHGENYGLCSEAALEAYTKGAQCLVDFTAPSSSKGGQRKNRITGLSRDASAGIIEELTGESVPVPLRHGYLCNDRGAHLTHAAVRAQMNLLGQASPYYRKIENDSMMRATSARIVELTVADDQEKKKELAALCPSVDEYLVRLNEQDDLDDDLDDDDDDDVCAQCENPNLKGLHTCGESPSRLRGTEEWDDDDRDVCSQCENPNIKGLRTCGDWACVQGDGEPVANVDLVKERKDVLTLKMTEMGTGSSDIILRGLKNEFGATRILECEIKGPAPARLVLLGILLEVVDGPSVITEKGLPYAPPVCARDIPRSLEGSMQIRVFLSDGWNLLNETAMVPTDSKRRGHIPDIQSLHIRVAMAPMGIEDPGPYTVNVSLVFEETS